MIQRIKMAAAAVASLLTPTAGHRGHFRSGVGAPPGERVSRFGVAVSSVPAPHGQVPMSIGTRGTRAVARSQRHTGGQAARGTRWVPTYPDVRREDPWHRKDRLCRYTDKGTALRGSCPGADSVELAPGSYAGYQSSISDSSQSPKEISSS